MAILVTGGAGYIGSHMVIGLLESGEQVVVLDNLSTGCSWCIPEGALFTKGDVGDETLLGDIFSRHQIDTVMHFAGSIVVPESVAHPLSYYLNNTVRSRSLIAAAVANGVRNFIFSSTAAVYGSGVESPVLEDSLLDPASPYGSSKLMTERMLIDTAHAHGLRYCILRYFNVAGADPSGRSGQSTPEATHLIKVACQAALGQRTHLEVFGTDYETPDGTCVRDYIHVSDLVQAHWQALQHLRRGGQNIILNCGYERGFSVLDVINVVKSVSKVDFEVRLGERRAGDPPILVASNKRIRETLGWRPQLGELETIVSHALRWEKRLAGRG
jgi:UDP-glucose 4-epimerase